MEILSLSITLGSVITVLGVIIAILSFQLNKKKLEKQNTKDAANDEARLVRIETDTLYIREKLDLFEKRFESFEERVHNLEKEVIILRSKKGGK